VGFFIVQGAGHHHRKTFFTTQRLNNHEENYFRFKKRTPAPVSSGTGVFAFLILSSEN
jgi:hypothetical protein